MQKICKSICRALPLILIVGGTTMLAAALVAKYVLLPSIFRGVDGMHYVDDTRSDTHAEKLIFKDLLSNAGRFEAFISSAELKRSACLYESRPTSGPLAVASRWCASGTEECEKIDVCAVGQKYRYHFFTLANPLEVVRGIAIPRVVELPPIHMLKAVDRHILDRALWDREGLAKFAESVKYSIQSKHKELSEKLISTKAIVANPLAFARLLPSSELVKSGRVVGGRRVLAHHLVAATALSKFYAKMNARMTEQGDSLRTAFGMVHDTGLDLNPKDYVLMEYYSGYLSSMVAILVERRLDLCEATIAKGDSSLAGDEATSVCLRLRSIISLFDRRHGGVSLNIGSALTASVFVKLPKFSFQDVPFLYEYTRGCHLRDRIESFREDSRVFCDMNDDTEPVEHLGSSLKANPIQAAHALPSFSPKIALASAEAYFQAISGCVAIDGLDGSDCLKEAMTSFLHTCSFSLDGTQVPIEDCRLMIEHMVYAGSRIAYRYNPSVSVQDILHGFGYCDTVSPETGACVTGIDGLSEKEATELVPYFVHIKVSDLMGFKNEDEAVSTDAVQSTSDSETAPKVSDRLNFDPVIKRPLTLDLWTNKTLDDLRGKDDLQAATGLDSSKPLDDSGRLEESKRLESAELTLTMSSKYMPQTWNYVSAFGSQYVCSYDQNCRSQKLFVESNGRKCFPELNGCNPPRVDGFEPMLLPGSVYGGNEHSSSHLLHSGSTLRMFVPDFAFAAEMICSSGGGRDEYKGIPVVKWTLLSVPILDANCDNPESKNIERVMSGSGASLVGLPGLDCDSPLGTKFIGSFKSPDRTKVAPNLYLSTPFFSKIPTDSVTRFKDSAVGVKESSSSDRYDPLSRVHLEHCKIPESDSSLELATADFCPIDPSDRFFGTEILSHLDTGAVVKGSLKIQVNTRVELPTRGPHMKKQRDAASSSGVSDFLMPMFWIEKYDSARSYQLESFIKLGKAVKLIRLGMVMSAISGSLLLLSAIGLMFLYRTKLFQKRFGKMYGSRVPAGMTQAPVPVVAYQLPVSEALPHDVHSA